MKNTIKSKELMALMYELHELKHKGKLQKELEKFRSTIECFDPEEI